MTFEELQKNLSDAIADSRQRDATSLSDNTHKLPLSDAFFCGEDSIKNKKFYDAISKALRDLRIQFLNEKIQVLDAGSGTGILGLLALILGADHVSFIEENPHTLSWSKKFIEQLGYSEKCTFYCEDAIEIQLPQKYHLLISETITIDFGKEDFHKIIAHLKNFLFPQAIIIPEGFDITFSQQDVYKRMLSENSISRISLGSSDSHTEKLFHEAQALEISGRVNLYSDIFLESGDCMSFFNKKSLLREDIGAKFVWGKE